jgi:hypothetical protein
MRLAAFAVYAVLTFLSSYNEQIYLIISLLPVPPPPCIFAKKGLLISINFTIEFTVYF